MIYMREILLLYISNHPFWKKYVGFWVLGSGNINNSMGVSK